LLELKAGATDHNDVRRPLLRRSDDFGSWLPHVDELEWRMRLLENPELNTSPMGQLSMSGLGVIQELGVEGGSVHFDEMAT